MFQARILKGRNCIQDILYAVLYGRPPAHSDRQAAFSKHGLFGMFLVRKGGAQIPEVTFKKCKYVKGQQISEGSSIKYHNCQKFAMQTCTRICSGGPTAIPLTPHKPNHDLSLSNWLSNTYIEYLVHQEKSHGLFSSSVWLSTENFENLSRGWETVVASCSVLVRARSIGVERPQRQIVAQ